MRLLFSGNRFRLFESDRGIYLKQGERLRFHSRDECIRHELLAGLAVLLCASPRRVLILGGGDGLCAREVLRFAEVEEVVVVEPDPELLEAARTVPRLVELTGASLSDARVQIVPTPPSAPFDLVVVPAAGGPLQALSGTCQRRALEFPLGAALAEAVGVRRVRLAAWLKQKLPAGALTKCVRTEHQGTRLLAWIPPPGEELRRHRSLPQGFGHLTEALAESLLRRAGGVGMSNGPGHAAPGRPSPPEGLVYGLTRHLHLQPDDLRPGYRAENLYYGTRLLLSEELWRVLETFQEPRPLGSDVLAQRAALAAILVPPDRPAPANPYLRQVSAALNRVLGEEGEPDPAALLDRLDRAEACSPPDRPLPRGRALTHYLWDDPERLCRVVFDHVRTYVREELGQPEGTVDPAFARLSLGRPGVKQRYEQQPCTIATALARARLVRSRHGAGSRILLLGDDDLVSLALGPDYRLDVFEIDEELVAFLAGRAPEGLRIHQHDLARGLPGEFHGRYDAVITDPMYAAEGLDGFLTCCHQGLKRDPEAGLYLSTCPQLLQSSQALFAGLAQRGLPVGERLQDFNRYPFPEGPRRATLEGLRRLGRPVQLFLALLEIPYLYADLFICRRA